MPQFLQLLPPDEARALLLSNIAPAGLDSIAVATAHALGRVITEDILAPHALPEFPRSTVDGYALRARDTFGAGDSQPAYLRLAGEIHMGAAAQIDIREGMCVSIHTGGMLPAGADAVVMLENTQSIAGRTGADGTGEIEVMKAIAAGENIIGVGEDVAAGQTVLGRGLRLRPAEIGGLMALGLTTVRVARPPRTGLISSGDEVVAPEQRPGPGQIRDVNAYTLSALVSQAGGEPILYGIVPDDLDTLIARSAQALAECDLVLISAGSSASTRDMTVDAVNAIGRPGVLVHGINTRPGKPTILGVCGGKAVIGLPGNPVSALINAYLFAVPVIERLLGLAADRPRPSLDARLSVNVASQAGREDWVPVKLAQGPDGDWTADPIFGKSNLIFSLASADGLLRIPPDATGAAAGSKVEIVLL